MPLAKAYIIRLDEHDRASGDRIEVMFNPGEYSIDKSNQFASLAIPGFSTPLTQFVSGNSATLTMDLFFDTYEKRESVRSHVDTVTGLLTIDEHLHAPPRCQFIWGEFQFKAVVEKVTRKFTMFLDDGTPVRAAVNVTFKEYKTLAEQIVSAPLSSADRSKIRTMSEGDSLWLMAYREYGDPGQWRRIAEANGIDDPHKVKAGSVLSVPPRP